MLRKTLILVTMCSLSFLSSVAMSDPPLSGHTDPVSDNSDAKSESTAHKERAEHKESAAHKTGEYMSDSALTAKVKAKLLAEKNLKSLHISVESTSGVVTLSGHVASSAQIEQAVDVTKHIKGVKDVHNALELKTASAE